MAGSLMPVAVAHGEGRTLLEPGANVRQVLRFVDNHGKPTQRYPANPNGSAAGLTGFTNDDGRFTILMPHPERVFLRKQMSWAPHDWHWEDSPWMRMFQNARAWIDRTAK
jgi:phosphoribosylformylglycinamidine synthase